MGYGFHSSYALSTAAPRFLLFFFFHLFAFFFISFSSFSFKSQGFSEAGIAQSVSARPSELEDHQFDRRHSIDVCFDFPLFRVAVALNTRKTEH